MMLDINKYSRFNFDQNINISGKNETHHEAISFAVHNSDLSYKTENNRYVYSLERNRFSDNKENIIIILSKDNGHILKYSLDKLYQFDIHKKYDILLVDDRSQTKDINNLSIEYDTSYLRIDNDKDIFNYSMLNNIAVRYAKIFNKQRSIFYNNDLWTNNPDTIDNLINKHILYKSGITGCKLLYPSEKEYQELGKPQHILSNILHHIYGSIQHGGISFSLKKGSFVDSRRNYTGPNFILGPIHQWRFYKDSHDLASFDTRCFAVTGAMHIIDTDSFIQLGGFTPSLPTSFQDIDLCMKAIESNIPVFYIGSESMTHAESLTHFKNNITKTEYFLSDNLFWDFVWGYKIPKIIGLKY